MNNSENFSELLSIFLTIPDGVSTLKVRRGVSDTLNKGSGALGEVK